MREILKILESVLVTLVISWIFTCKRLYFIKWQQKSVPLLPKNGAVRGKLFHSLGEFLEPSPAPAIHSPVRLRKTMHNPESPRHSGSSVSSCYDRNHYKFDRFIYKDLLRYLKYIYSSIPHFKLGCGSRWKKN